MSLMRCGNRRMGSAVSALFRSLSITTQSTMTTSAHATVETAGYAVSVGVGCFVIVVTSAFPTSTMMPRLFAMQRIGWGAQISKIFKRLTCPRVVHQPLPSVNVT
jgi:hypothetical protein